MSEAASVTDTALSPMRELQSQIARLSAEFEAQPFFEFLRDQNLTAKERLAFAPALAHFVMTFADLYRFVLREEPARDKYQEIVNAHTYEDGGHWKWFLADLGKLEGDPNVPFSDALRFVWSDETIKLRMLSYEMCQLGLGASSIHKLVLVQCIEATGSVMLKNIMPAGKALASASGKNLVYFGAHHLDTESEHTIEQDDAQRVLDSLELQPALARELASLVDRTFAAFTAATQEMLAFSQKPTLIAKSR